MRWYAKCEIGKLFLIPILNGDNASLTYLDKKSMKINIHVLVYTHTHTHTHTCTHRHTRTHESKCACTQTRASARACPHSGLLRSTSSHLVHMSLLMTLRTKLRFKWMAYCILEHRFKRVNIYLFIYLFIYLRPQFETEVKFLSEFRELVWYC